MKLDDRIIGRKYIFDCFNADEAKEYIGEDCYMTNDLELYKDLDRVRIYRLDCSDKIFEPFFYNEENDEYFDYCLPVRFVRPTKEKVYKPFDPVTFEQHYRIGSVIKYRNKDKKDPTYKSIVESRIDHEHTKAVYYVINGYPNTLDDLFKKYEICEYDEWKPFGVVAE